MARHRQYTSRFLALKTTGWHLQYDGIYYPGTGCPEALHVVFLAAHAEDEQLQNQYSSPRVL